jgi:hypothetical protein
MSVTHECKQGVQVTGKEVQVELSKVCKISHHLPNLFRLRPYSTDGRSAETVSDWT